MLGHPQSDGVLIGHVDLPIPLRSGKANVSFVCVGVVGYRILWHSTAIMRRLVPYVFFCLAKSMLWPQKLQKTWILAQHPVGNLAFFGNSAEDSIHFPIVRMIYWSALSTRPRSCRHFPHHSDQCACSCRLMNIWGYYTHPTSEKQQKLIVLVRIDAHVWPISVFLSVWWRATTRPRQVWLRCFGILEGFRFIRACMPNTCNHCLLVSRVRLLASVWRFCNCRQNIFQPEIGGNQGITKNLPPFVLR